MKAPRDIDSSEHDMPRVAGSVGPTNRRDHDGFTGRVRRLRVRMTSGTHMSALAKVRVGRVRFKWADRELLAH